MRKMSNRHKSGVKGHFINISICYDQYSLKFDLRINQVSRPLTSTLMIIVELQCEHQWWFIILQVILADAFEYSIHTKHAPWHNSKSSLFVTIQTVIWTSAANFIAIKQGWFIQNCLEPCRHDLIWLDMHYSSIPLGFMGLISTGFWLSVRANLDRWHLHSQRSEQPAA